MIDVATSRYFAKAKVLESGLCPLGCTTGAPKYQLGYELAGNIGLLAPFGLREIEDKGAFEKAYRARVDGFGREKIQPLLEAFADATETKGVVLLCYEDLADARQWCHRTIFAAWWREQTGCEVVEL